MSCTSYDGVQLILVYVSRRQPPSRKRGYRLREVFHISLWLHADVVALTAAGEPAAVVAGVPAADAVARVGEPVVAVAGVPVAGVVARVGVLADVVDVAVPPDDAVALDVPASRHRC